jgi:hypothetical protein
MANFGKAPQSCLVGGREPKLSARAVILERTEGASRSLARQHSALLFEILVRTAKTHRIEIGPHTLSFGALS